jgi:hypothetical protein
LIGFCQRWQNIAWGDSRYAEFCREADALFTAGAEAMREIDGPVIETARALIASLGVDLIDGTASPEEKALAAAMAAVE